MEFKVWSPKMRSDEIMCLGDEYYVTKIRNFAFSSRF